MMERADGRSVGFAESVATGAGFGFGKAGFGATGACGVCAMSVAPIAVNRRRTRPVRERIAARTEQDIKLGIQGTPGRTRILTGLLRDAGNHAHHVMQIDGIAGLEVARNRLAPDACEAYLSLR